MTEEMSALLYGELAGFDDAHRGACLHRPCADPALRRGWAVCLIGECAATQGGR